ncbi:phosphate/phosphite/phosphonate ABC transporter substrate-binding protein [Paenochrobactrum sp. BZR 588]|uniref:phosphate/phosphite/phosphonate ABC transporter substrate-binding protein n=1 Tax=Paenochrobactrum TaxID=999488 RepID=UPI0035BC0C5B
MFWRKMACHTGVAILTAILGAQLSIASATDNACANRGALDERYCDENNDLVADAPKDPSQWRDPQTLVWAYTPIEDPAVYARLFKPFTQHLEACLGRQIVYYPIQSSADEIEAMRSGRLHFAGFSTGPTIEAVNRAGAVPFAAKGTGNEMRGYRLVAVVRADSPYKDLSDLKGKRIAHASLFSNSGNVAPRALFPKHGLTPVQDYAPIMSGGHDKSVLGVVAGDYDMAAVASDVLERMIERGLVKRDAVRLIYQSDLFPTSSFAYAHNLAPSLVSKMKHCFFNFTFTPEMKAEFQGDDHFIPIEYAPAWSVVREVNEQAGAVLP